MPRHFWRTVVGALVLLATYAGLVKHDGTFCHDAVRTVFRTHTTSGKCIFLALLVGFAIHILHWPKDRPRPSRG